MSSSTSSWRNSRSNRRGGSRFSGTSQGPNSSRKRHSSNNRPNSGRRGPSRYHSHRRRSGPPLTREEQLVNKYLTLLDLHLSARSKYYDVFEGRDHNRRLKWEKSFFQTLEDLRRFEETLSVEDKSLLETHINGQRPDLTYSSNRNIPPDFQDPPPSAEEIEDPHFLISQQKALEEFQGDQEESVGNMDDYLKYKGSGK